MKRTEVQIYTKAMVAETREMLKHLDPRLFGDGTLIMGAMHCAFKHNALAGLKLYDEWASGRLTGGTCIKGHCPADSARAWNSIVKSFPAVWNDVLTRAQRNGYEFKEERTREILKRA